LKKFAHPTIAGREIKEGDIRPTVNHWMLVPYQRNGKLLDVGDMADLISYLREPENEKKLLSRTCVKRKPWYAFHETPLLTDILRPKIIFKDITERPVFLKDEDGQILPRHSVYYLVPKDPKILDDLVDYLNSEEARVWLVSHCHRAANGFIRIQSNILKKLPIPDRFVDISSKVPFRVTVDQEV
jgi:adenine-specific DNA-methyltransferase